MADRQAGGRWGLVGLTRLPLSPSLLEARLESLRAGGKQPHLQIQQVERQTRWYGEAQRTRLRFLVRTTDKEVMRGQRVLLLHLILACVRTLVLVLVLVRVAITRC